MIDRQKGEEEMGSRGTWTEEEGKVQEEKVSTIYI